jgi:hypothetical protein
MHTAGARYATHALISRGWSGALVLATGGLGLDTSWETRSSEIQTLSSYSGDLHLPQRLEGGGPPGTCTNGLRVQE